MLRLVCEAGARFAISAKHVVEVIARPRLEPIAGKPDWFAGVFAYRGRPTPVIDLSRLTAGKSEPPMWSNRIVIVPAPGSSPDRLVGLLVHRAAAEQRDGEEAEVDSQYRLERWGPTMVEEGGMLCMLDLHSILTPERLAAIFPPSPTAGGE